MFDYFKNINYFSFYNIETDKDNDYLSKLKECVDNIISAYRDEQYSFPKDKVNLICDEINKTYKCIVKAYNDSLSGHYEEAIKNIRGLVIKYQEILIRPLNKTWAFFNNIKLKDNIYFYKGRISEEPFGNYSYEEMHIIPSNRRELISTQRYSIPGVPCLYLASNTFIVWNELGRPRFDNLCVSCFKIENPSMKVLDLSYGYRTIFEEMAENYLEYQEEVIPINDKDGNKIEVPLDFRFSQFFTEVNKDKMILLASIYPLLASVSIHCKDKNRKFKSEYVISQLLMHSLGECKGILYRSSAMDGKYGLPAINLAIPNLVVDSKKLYGYIGDYVKVTDSFNLQYYFDNCSNIMYKYRTKEHNPYEINNYVPKSTFNIMLDKFAGSNTYDLNFVYKGSIYYFFDDYLIDRNDFKKIENK